jgi:hypothetical protein
VVVLREAGPAFWSGIVIAAIQSHRIGGALQAARRACALGIAAEKRAIARNSASVLPHSHSYLDTLSMVAIHNVPSAWLVTARPT